MEIKNIDIARVALCSEGAVRKAKFDGKLESLEGVVSFCLAGRLKGVGIEFADELSRIKTGAEVEEDGRTCEDDYSQLEGEW